MGGLSFDKLRMRGVVDPERPTVRIECLTLACHLAKPGTADVTILQRAATFEHWVMRDVDVTPDEQEQQPPEKTTDD